MYSLREFLLEKGNNSITREQAACFGLPYDALGKGWIKRYAEISTTKELFNLALSQTKRGDVEKKARRLRRKSIKEEQKVYVLMDDKGYFKIGISSNIVNRIRSISTMSTNKVFMIRLFTMTTYLAENVEKKLHNLFVKKRIKGEWFGLHIEDLRAIDNYVCSLGGIIDIANTPNMFSSECVD